MSTLNRVAVASTIGVALLIACAVAWLGLHRPAAATVTARIATATATVTVGTVAQRQTQQGTLTDARQVTAVNNEPSGIYTRLPGSGSVLRQGDTAYEVNQAPVVLMYGDRPMWRPFTLGMSDGPDIRQLERDLVKLGYDPDHAITVSAHFTWAAAVAVERWQHALGLPETGSVPLGQILFLPSAIQVGTVAVSTGMPATAGATVFTGTTLTPSVVVDLDPQAQLPARTGQQVVITLPDGSTTTGRISQVQPVTSLPSGGAATSGASGSGGSQAVIPVIIRLDHPRRAGPAGQAPVQVQFTTAVHHHVLAVPTTALLAEPGGRYAVQIASPSGLRLVTVTTGLFDDVTGRVEVASPQLRPDMKVEVPAP
jgi:hypothetical protein